MFKRSTGDQLSHLYQRSGAEALGFAEEDVAAIVEDVIARAYPGEFSAEKIASAAGKLWLEDLLLTRACARGSEAAWERFLALYSGKIHRAARSIAKEDAAAHELAATVLGDLFGTRVNETGKRICKLEMYLGRCPLEAWLRAVLAQQYVDEFRTRRRLVSFDAELENTTVSGRTGFAGPLESSELISATDIALGALSADDRFLLAAYYLDGRTLAEIGRMLKVHESTISRRLGKITSGIRKRIAKELRGMGMSKREIEEVFNMDVQNVGIDLASRLAQERRA